MSNLLDSLLATEASLDHYVTEHDSNAFHAELYSHKFDGQILAMGSYHAFGKGRDVDYTILMKDGEEAKRFFDELGYEFNQAGRYAGDDDRFFTMRKGDVNLIITTDPFIFERNRIAFDIVKALQLTDRDQRVLVHQICREECTHVDGVLVFA